MSVFLIDLVQTSHYVQNQAIVTRVWVGTTSIISYETSNFYPNSVVYIEYKMLFH